MKKILYFMSLALVMFAFTSCGGGAADTPEGAVENLFNAAKNGDIKGMIACCCDSEGEPYELDDLLEDVDEEKVDKMLAKAEKKMKKELEDAEIEIGKVKMNDDEDRATVKVTIKKGKKKDNKTFTCIKGSDDKWRVREYPL